MAEIHKAPDIEIIDNEKIISEKITNCKSNCESNSIKLEGLLMLIKYDAKLENHDIDLAFDKNNNSFHIICDTAVLNTSLDVTNLENTLSNIVMYIKLGEEKNFTNLGGLMKGYDLIGDKYKRVLVKNGIGGTTVRDQIYLNNTPRDKRHDGINYKQLNNISEDMYVFLQNILDPDGNWEINNVCEGEGVTQECIDTLGTGTNGEVVNKIKTIREATSEDIEKFN